MCIQKNVRQKLGSSMQIKQLLSDEARAEFLNFPYYLFP